MRNRLLLSLLVGLLSPASPWAAPGPAQGCGGTFGVGGCAPYSAFEMYSGGVNERGYEYESIPLGVSRSDGLSSMSATVNLSTGSLFASADVDWGGGRSTSIASAADVFVFHSTGGLAGQVLVDFVVQADATSLFAARGPSGGASVNIFSPMLAAQPGSVGGGVVFQGGYNNVPVGVLFESSFSSVLRAWVPLNVPVQINYLARTDVYEGAEFTVSGQLNITPPPGVTFSSYEGFVTQVPEPSNPVLLVAGLAAIYLVVRRRAATIPDGFGPSRSVAASP